VAPANKNFRRSKRTDNRMDNLIEDMTEELFNLMEQTLDYAQIAISDPSVYKNYRSRILRIFNNSVRNLTKSTESTD